jgi:TRAP-type mannitol/chloroaromatic compound transport system permease small subunit
MVAILFLQMPYTIYRGAHLRTAVIYQNLNEYGQRIIDFIVALLGIWFFYSIVLGSWGDMIIGWDVDEREGEGSISVPIYPIRTLLVVFAGISLISYLILAWYALTGSRPSSEDK